MVAKILYGALKVKLLNSLHLSQEVIKYMAVKNAMKIIASKEIAQPTKGGKEKESIGIRLSYSANYINIHSRK